MGDRGDLVGIVVGESVGFIVGEFVGLAVGESVGVIVGEFVGLSVGAFVGSIVGAGAQVFMSEQNPVLQSSLTVQSSFWLHRGHSPPPQSTSVSKPFFTLSAH